MKSILSGVLLLLAACTDPYISIDVEPNGIMVDGIKVESLVDSLNKHKEAKNMKVMLFITQRRLQSCRQMPYQQVAVLGLVI